MSIRTVCLSTAVACALIGLGCGGMHKDNDMSKSDMKSDMAMPMAKGDIIDVATGPGMERVTTLVAAVKAADLVGTLKGPGPFTVLAPTNEAFAKLPPGTVEDLLKPENKQKLRRLLMFHVIPGKHDAAEVMSMSSAKTAEGDMVMIKTTDGKVMVGNDKSMATVGKPDIQATNGVIHWIDTVLMPQ